MVRRKHTPQQWRQWIEQQRSGKSSVRSFCQQHGLCLQTFYRWRRKLGGASGDSAEMISVQVVPDGSPIQASNVVSIHLPCGTRLETPTDTSTLTSVLRAVRLSAESPEANR